MTLTGELAALERERADAEAEVVKAQRDRNPEREAEMFEVFGRLTDRLRIVRVEIEAAGGKEGASL